MTALTALIEVVMVVLCLAIGAWPIAAVVAALSVWGLVLHYRSAR